MRMQNMTPPTYPARPAAPRGESRLAASAISAGTLATMMAATVLSGCLPIPHREQDIPNIAGSVSLDGQPLAGADIYVTHRFNPTVETKVATTNAAGRFEVAGSKRFFGTVALGDPAYEFKLRIVANGQSYAAFATRGLGFAPAPMLFSCDLSPRLAKMCAVQALLPARGK